MIVLTFFTWWYGEGWRSAKKRTLAFYSGLSQTFSVSQLTKTLFEPWRRITTTPGKSISAHGRAFVDNSISRLVGFCVRSIVLLTALFCYVILGFLGFVQLIFWPLMPPAVIILLVAGIL